MSPKMGRPPSENPRQVRVESRMTLQELEKLDFCCEKTGKSRSEILREGVELVYSRLHDPRK